MTTDNNLRPPLHGITVINAGQILAAPHCATMLAEFGADVIKVERPASGEPNHGTISYVQENRSQRGVTCNLADPRGKDLFRRLCAQADVLIENFRPGTLEKMDLAPDSLRELNPGLVVTRISGYGQSGPYRERAGFDRVALGFAGMTYQTGWADGPPVRPGYMVADYSAGVFAAMGTMIALRARDVNGGLGQDVDVALYEAIWKQSGTHASQFQMTGQNRERTGNYWPGVVPAEQWETADGHHLIINATTQGTFERLVAAMDRADLLSDPRFEIHGDRRKNYEAIHEIVGAWIGTLTLDQVQDQLDKHGVPATKVYATSDIMADEHYQAREQIVNVPSEQHGELQQPGIVPRLSMTPGEVKHRAPTLGEHNREVYVGMLGLNDDELERLVADGVI
jgi:crotonobetainyl-CoA:carnitine CoA-transferase CaiB-like acyl-CoA transferase